MFFTFLSFPLYALAFSQSDLTTLNVIACFQLASLILGSIELDLMGITKFWGIK